MVLYNMWNSCAWLDTLDRDVMEHVDVDGSGNLIPDPRTANRGPYTVFCTFMVVMHGHIKIN